MWIGERPAGAGRNNGLGSAARTRARPEVEISRDARAAQEAEAADNDSADDGLDPRFRFLKHLVEALTGRAIRTLQPEDFRADEAMPSLVEPPPAAGRRGDTPGRAGFGIEYDFRSVSEEYEFTRFEAKGVVRTADGHEIDFALQLEMERAYTETSSIQVRLGDARVKDPLVLDFAGTSAQLSDVRFSFDLDADGQAENVPMLSGGRGYLAIDRNRNGRIDDGRELFGPTTGDGFTELAGLDTDGSGWIDEGDANFGDLRVWMPAVDGAGSVVTATEAGVGALYLGRVATPFALRGAANDTLGEMRSTGLYVREDGTTGTVSQIDLSV
ncbi:hypothetical protein [Aromatoleum petrolei]